jgi:2-iminobutanoate/2-iminopropanoate deaminase
MDMSTPVSERTTEVRAHPVALPIGPYSQALLGKSQGRLLAISGQGGFDRSGKLVALGPDAVGAQADRIFENIRCLVEAAGGSMNDPISLTVYLRTAAGYPAFNESRQRHLRHPYPASATVTDVGFVVDGMEIEISALAVV